MKEIKEGAHLFEAEKQTTKNVSDRISEQIEQWIEKGQVNPGDKLPSVRELCELFGVGRSAVRDALTTLKGKGVLDVKQGEGSFIRRFDTSLLFDGLLLLNEKDISQLFGVRKVLETGIAETAAIYHTPYHLHEMKEALDYLKNEENNQGWESDYQFHLAIVKATQNDILVQLMQTVSSSIQKAMIDCHTIIQSDNRLKETIQRQHIAIYQAIESGHTEKARKEMFYHLSYVEELLQQTVTGRHQNK
ncbi:FadR/GntR family transcriptional regulator [Scopulibacillus cellulosilyticus]|uniref:FadR/GntR family transcriptional regulator n=1 Tax=Scopulibacillus cellulosilyticus TaxID=2665665 RepID=A0ABW2PX92_9BACL